MKCVILVAGLDQRLEDELKADLSGKYEGLRGVPKALLPTADKATLLDNWWEAIRWAQTRNQFDGVYLVTNAEKFKHYERWATASGFPRENVINDGTTASTGGIGALADLWLALSSRNMLDSDVMVVSGDMLFNPKRFDIMGVCSFFKAHKKDGDVACYYEMGPHEDCTTRGIVHVDPSTKRITQFVEKPKASDSRLASIVFYIFRKETIPVLKRFLDENESSDKRHFGNFFEYFVPKSAVYGMKLPDHFELIGSVGLDEYEAVLQKLPSRPRASVSDSGHIVCRTYARVGVLGNPSDGFFESDKIELIRHPLNDPTTFGSLADLHAVSVHEQYMGGLRLMQATCKKFHEYCSSQGIAIARKNFTLRYDTNIPRQVGLAGSSAIVTSTMKCLMKFFGVSNTDIPKDKQPNFVLSVEMGELGINAGLQDRVIQVYGGLVYMNFDQAIMERDGCGVYESLPMDNLPKFWLSYLADPSDSGKAHNDVRKRWDSGDTEVREGMKGFANITDRGKAALAAGDFAALADLMDENFALRRKLYTDAALGKGNLQMAAIAAKHKAAAKFSGSGGAVLGLCRDDAQLAALRDEMRATGFVFVSLIPNIPTPE